MQQLSIKINNNHIFLITIANLIVTGYCLLSIEEIEYSLAIFMLLLAQTIVRLNKPKASRLTYHKKEFYLVYSTHTTRIMITKTFLSKYFYLIIYNLNNREKDFLLIINPKPNPINAYLNNEILKQLI